MIPRPARRGGPSPAPLLLLLAPLTACGGDSPKDTAGGDDTASCQPSTWYRDADGDGYGDATAPVEACEPPTGHVADATDCDDAAAAVHPGAPEVWYDGADEDCAGDDDFDQDRDGAARGEDCDDADAAVNPGAPEDCATEADDDCDGQADEPDALGCTPWYADDDADGVGAGEPMCTCEPHDTYTVTVGGDCDDADASVSPRETETCDGRDEDCDGTADDGLALYYVDADGDGDGTGTPTCTPAAGRVTTGTDCNDGDRYVYGGAPELCDLRQNDCAATSWSAGDEDGRVSFVDTAGAWTDVTATLGSGVESAPATVGIGVSGAVQWCPGAYFVNLGVPAGAGVALDFDFPHGPATVTLDGGGVGRILTLEDGNGPFHLQGGAYQGGYGSSGGAIWNDGNDLTITDALFSENVATFAGGAVAQGGGTLTLRAVTAEYNDAAAWGGAVYLGDASLDVSSSSFAYNQATGGTGDGMYGGAICAFSTAGNVEIGIDGSSFVGNEAGSWGEDFGSGGAVAIDVVGPATITVSGSTFSSNAVYADSDAYGGSMSVNVSGQVATTLTDVDAGTSFASARGTAQGGALFLGNNASEPMTLTNVTVDQNAVYSDGDGQGGGLAYRSYATTTELLLTALTASVGWTYDSVGSLYGDGGGLYLGMSGGSAYLDGASVHDCAATTGAGISADLAGGAHVDLYGGSLVSGNDGAGIRVDIVSDYGYLYIYDGSVESNTANGVELDAAAGTTGTLYLYGSTGRQGSLANGGIGVYSGCAATSTGACAIYASLWDLGDYGTADDNATGDIYFFNRLYDRLGTDWSGNCLTSAC